MTEKTFHDNRIEVLALGRRFRKPETENSLMEHYQITRFRDVLQISLLKGEIWLFDYGVVVCWGIQRDARQNMLDQLAAFTEEAMPHRELEHYQFDMPVDGTLRIQNDKLTLASPDHLQRLAASHAFAQSAKLGVFETLAQNVIAENAYLSRVLTRTGRIPLNRRALAKLRGLLFQTRSDILLNFNLLDTPEFFWDYPEVEPIYNAVAKYLDLVPRIELLNHKLETIHELVDMLASEQNHKHSSFLEWIIILLIAVEILMSFVR